MRDSGRTSGYSENLNPLRCLLLLLCLFLGILCILCRIDDGKKLIYTLGMDQVLCEILIHQKHG